MALNATITQPTVRWAPMYADVMIPDYAEPGSACRDISAYLQMSTTVTAFCNVSGDSMMLNVRPVVGAPIGVGGVRIPPLTRCIIPTGLRFVLQPGWEIQMRPRSSYIKSTMRMVNTPATLDASYRGEIGLLIENISTARHLQIENGQRLAQLMIAPVPVTTAETLPVGADLDAMFGTTQRGEGAYGSTGK